MTWNKGGTMPKYRASQKVTIAGRTIQSGETFDATEREVADALRQGHVTEQSGDTSSQSGSGNQQVGGTGLPITTTNTGSNSPAEKEQAPKEPYQAPK